MKMKTAKKAAFNLCDKTLCDKGGVWYNKRKKGAEL